MISVVLRVLFYVKTCDRVGDEVDVHDINAVFAAQWQCRQSGQKHERAYHVELCGLGASAVA